MISDVHMTLSTRKLGTEPGAAILSVGIVKFVPAALLHGIEEWRGRLRTLKVNVCLDSCLKAGLVISAPTLKRWMLDTDEALKDAFASEGGETSLLEACGRIKSFILSSHDGVRIWSHGPSLDAPILGAAMKSVGHTLPWDHADVRDTGTILELAGIPHPGPHYSPVKDCIEQAVKLSEAMIMLQSLTGGCNKYGRSSTTLPPEGTGAAA